MNFIIAKITDEVQRVKNERLEALKGKKTLQKSSTGFCVEASDYWWGNSSNAVTNMLYLTLKIQQNKKRVLDIMRIVILINKVKTQTFGHIDILGNV